MFREGINIYSERLIHAIAAAPIQNNPFKRKNRNTKKPDLLTQFFLLIFFIFSKTNFTLQ